MRCSCILAWSAAMSAACMLVGCAPALVLHMRVTQPPALRALSYPVAFLAAGDDAESRAAADAIAARLAANGLTVERITPDEALAPHAEAARAIAIVVEISHRTRPEASAASGLVPCFGSKMLCGRPVRRATETQIWTATIRTLDAVTGQPIATRRVVERVRGPVGPDASATVRERLRERVTDLFVPHDETLDLPLIELDDAFVVRLVRDGWIHDARLAVEARLASESAPSEVRAALLFDDAQLLRLDRDASAADPATELDRRLARAADLLDAAIALTNDDRFRRAREQLDQERDARAEMRAEAEVVSQHLAMIPVPPPPAPP